MLPPVWSRPVALLLASLPWVCALELNQLEDGSAAKLTSLGNVEMAQGRYETAIAHYKQALQAGPGYFTALYNLGLANQMLGQGDQARQWYLEALRVSPEHPEVLCNLGVLAYAAGQWQEAADRFIEAARMAAQNPNDAADYWFNAGTAREKLGRWEEAQRAYHECLALNGQHVGGHYNLGTLHLTALADRPGAAKRALGFLQEAARLAPERPEVWVNLALCRERNGVGEIEECFVAALKAAEARAPDRVGQVRWQHACYLARCQPPDRLKMRDELKRILAEDDDFPDANGMLGSYYFSLAEFEAAQRHLEKETQRQPDEPSDIWLESHFLLAVIFTDHRVDPAKALLHAQEYYKRRPDSPKIHELRRRALRLTGASGGEALVRPVSSTSGAVAPKAPAAPGPLERSAPPTSHATPALPRH